jgi:hypothetical protein
MLERKKTTTKSDTQTHPLGMKIGGMALSIKEIPVAPGVVNAIQFPLPHEQISLSK